MSRPRSSLRNRAEYLAARGVDLFLRLLPAGISLPMLRAIGRFGAWVQRGRRERTMDNIVRALGCERAEARRIVSDCYVSMTLNLAEPFLLERALARRPLEEHVVIEGAEHLDAALQQGRGVLLATAHFGAWESFGSVLSQRFKTVWAVARAIDNPLLDGWFRARRGRTSAGTIEKDGGGMKIARLLRQGEIVFALLDQNAGSQGVDMDFLGVPATHHRVAGAMAARFGAAVIPAYFLREKGALKFRLIVEPAVEPRADLEGEAQQLDVIRRVSDSLEAQVRRHPGQWLWLHDRWKRALRALKIAAKRARLEKERADAEALSGTSVPGAPKQA